MNRNDDNDENAPLIKSSSSSKSGGDEGVPNPLSLISRDFIAFWFLGFLNNYIWVATNAGAANIMPSAIALVYLCNIVPTMLIKLAAPYFFHLISYRVRGILSATLMVVALMSIAWIPREHPYLRLCGVCTLALQSGIGEASCLALATAYDARKMLIAWSSGTGMAGVGGYVASKLSSRLDVCFQMQMTVSLVVPLAYLIFFFVILTPPSIDDARKEGKAPASDNWSAGQKFAYVASLWPYMIPLYVVYASEYAMQSGTWTTVGFPVHSRDSRNEFYKQANLMYQVGVFISRSLGGCVVPNRLMLWIAPTMQFVFLVIFTLISLYHWSEQIGELALTIFALVTGFLGGYTYVAAFVLINHEQPKDSRELALTAASVADSFGIVTANFSGIYIQSCLFFYNDITDTKPKFQCPFVDGKAFQEKYAHHVSDNPAPNYASTCYFGIQGEAALRSGPAQHALVRDDFEFFSRPKVE